MGKNRRAAKAARAAAAAASTPAPSTTSPATPLDITVTPAAPATARDSREPAPAPTHQQYDVHAPNTRPAPHASSAASQTTRPSSTSVRTPHSDPTPPFASEREPIGHPTATNRESCRATAHHAPHEPSTASTASHTTPASSSGASARSSTPVPSANTRKAERQPVDTPRGTREVHNADAHTAPQPTSTAPQPTSTASRTRSATSPDVSATPSRTTRASAAENEPDGLVRAREDRTHAQPARTTPHAPPSAQRAAPSAPHDVPASMHDDTTPPTPGFEPGGPQMAAASETHNEPALLDASHVEELVATALRRGHEAGLKEGRNVGFREGLEAGKRAGVAEGREEGFMEGIELGRLEVSTTPSTPPPHDAPYEARSINDIHPDLLDAIMRQGERRGLKEGRKAGRQEAREEGREAGFKEGLDAGRTMGTMEGREQGYGEGRSAGLREGREDGRAEVRRIPRAVAAIQTDVTPPPAHANFAAQTERIPTVARSIATEPHSLAQVDTSSQTDDSNAHNVPKTFEKTQIHSRHDTFKTDINHCNTTVPIVNNCSPTRFSWADEAESLPINSVPPLPMRRDFTVLRSGTTTSPFGSLQRRARRAHRPNLHPPQRSWSRPVVEPAPIVTRRHPAGLRAGRPALTQVSTQSSSPPMSSSPLDWDGDPRLLELSRVLQSLGWVRSLAG